MDKIVNIRTVAEYNEYWGLETRHPLVNVLEGSQITHPIPNCRKNFDLYVIFLKDVMCADYLKYGRKEYDYQENTLVFVSPGQVLGYPATVPPIRRKVGASISVLNCCAARSSDGI